MLAARSYSLPELEKLTGFDRRTVVYYIQEGLLPRVGRRGPNTRYPEETLLRLRFIKGVKALQTSGQLLNVTLGDMRAVLQATPPERIEALVNRGLPAAPVELLFATMPAAGAGRAEQQPQQPPAAWSSAGQGSDSRSYGLADASVRSRALQGRMVESPAAMYPAMHKETPSGRAREVPAELRDWAAAETPSPDRAAVPEPPATMSAPPENEVPARTPEAADLGELLRQLELQSSLGRNRLPPGASEQWTEIPITSRVFLSIRGLAEEDAALADAVARLLKRTLRGR